MLTRPDSCTFLFSLSCSRSLLNNHSKYKMCKNNEFNGWKHFDVLGKAKMVQIETNIFYNKIYLSFFYTVVLFCEITVDYHIDWIVPLYDN